MRNHRLVRSLLFLPVVLVLGSAATVIHSAQERAPQDATPTPAELHYKTPEGWIAEASPSKMRVAQFKLPKSEGDSEDASLVLYYFGPQQGGSVQANVERWIGQMKQPEAEPTKPKTETMTINGLKITMVDAVGTYTAETSPGSGTFHNKTGFRLLAAVIETPKGPYFVKLVGPARTLGRWERSYMDFVRSFDFK